MGIFKIKLVLFLIIAISLSSCDVKPSRGSDKYIKLLKECQNIQNQKDEAVKSAYHQLESINTIFEQLAAINTDIGNVRMTTPNAEIPDRESRVAVIDTFIVSIRDKLDQLENDNQNLKSGNAGLATTIGYLKEIVTQKENEIVTLKDNLNIKDTIIEKQSQKILKRDFVIREQENTISGKNQEIRQLQIEKWSRMGEELFQVYSEYQDISAGLFKKSENERRMMQNKRIVLGKAKKCFEEAVSLGSRDDISNLTMINEAIDATK
jgi:chromosome segregation ATPase